MPFAPLINASHDTIIMQYALPVDTITEEHPFTGADHKTITLQKRYISPKKVVITYVKDTTEGFWITRYKNGMISERGKFTTYGRHKRRTIARFKTGEWHYYSPDGKLVSRKIEEFNGREFVSTEVSEQ
ncbi:MAG: hypothetical protein V4649_03970 [Bacteroidota bacterium]